MGAVPLGGGPPMAPLPPVQQLGFGISRWRLQGNATLGLRAGGRGHHLFFLPHKTPLLARSGHAETDSDLSAFWAKRTCPVRRERPDRALLTQCMVRPCVARG